MSATATRVERTESRHCRAAAHEYERRGWRVVPLARRTKRPTEPEWETGRYRADDVADDGNVGLLLGALSGGLVDVDLDTLEACAAWSYYVLPTAMRSGRASAPASHWWYALDAAPAKTERLREPPRLGDDEGATLIELRSTGGQTVVWPSLHEDTGELITWEADGEPGRVDVTELQRAVRHTAAIAMLAPKRDRRPARLMLSATSVTSDDRSRRDSPCTRRRRARVARR
jgi:hypothetical protein